MSHGTAMSPLTPLARFRLECASTLHLALPLILAQLLQVGMGLIDTLMAGRLGAVELAAVGLGSSLWILVFLACSGTLMALSPLIAHLNGENDKDAITRQFQQGLWVALLVGLLAIPLTYLTSLAIPLIGVSGMISERASDYLRILAWSMPGLCLYLAGRYLCEGMGHTRPVLLVQLLLLPLNVLGNTLLMFGYLGFPALGALGAAWSTAIGLWIGAGCMLGYLARSRRFQALALFQQVPGPDWRQAGRLLSLGLPIAIAITLEAGLFSAVALLMGRLGPIAMAAHQVALNYASLMFMMPLGISQAITIRVGHALGQKDPQLARWRGQSGIMLAGGIMLTSALVMLLLRHRIVAFYTTDLQVAQLAVQLLFAAALFQFSDGLQVSAAGALRGFKDTRRPMLITLFSYWVIGLPTAWYLGLETDMGPQGLWIGLLAGLSVAALLLNRRFHQLSTNAAGARCIH